MQRKRISIGAALSAISGIYAIYGIVKEIARSKLWSDIQNPTINWEAGSYVVALIFSLSILLWGFYPTAKRRLINWALTQSEKLETSPVGGEAEPQRGHQAGDVKDRPEDHCDVEIERHYTPRSACEIFQEITDFTGVQIENHKRLFVGKWLKVEEDIVDVSPHRDGEITAMTWAKRDELWLVSLTFDRNSASSLETAQKGDCIVAQGKIKDFDRKRMSLENCKLLELRPRDRIDNNRNPIRIPYPTFPR